LWFQKKRWKCEIPIGSNVSIPIGSNVKLSRVMAAILGLWPQGQMIVFSSPGHRPCELLSWVSLRRPSVSFSHLTLLLWNRWTDFNQTCQKCSLDGILPDLCFWYLSGKTNKLWSGQASLRRSRSGRKKSRLKQYVSLRSKGRHN
jgi:hypothetical protein